MMGALFFNEWLLILFLEINTYPNRPKQRIIDR